MVRTPSPRCPRRHIRLRFLPIALLAVLFALQAPSGAARVSPRDDSPPPPGGYFDLVPAGAWETLPGDTECASAVHRSSWEPRPDNATPDNTMPDAEAVHQAFAARPRSGGGGFDTRWDTWLLPRVDGQFTGATDEIFQWGACKWGLPDDLLRAIAVRESTWYQYEVYPSGRPVINWGSGDLVDQATQQSAVFCAGLANYGRDYQQDFGPGLCPKTFSIMGVMSWQDPSWGEMLDNQNGTYPFNRLSTALAVDYLGSQLRGCFEGWQTYLGQSGDGSYQPGRIWGCVGAWYSGAWHDQAADGYISRVRHAERHYVWLKPGWPDVRPPCSPDYGCPQGA